MVKHVLRDAPRPDMSLRDPLKTLDRLEADVTKTLHHHLEQRREDPNVPVLVELGDLFRAGSDSAVIRVDQRAQQGAPLNINESLA
eukprot:15311345-Alexandrium_andersonii.AAC.1